jgi:hypothetical protein
MSSQTPKLGITLWDGNDSVNRQAFNDNWTKIDETAASQADLDAHKNDTNNPHRVTAAQVGAVPVSAVGQPSGVAPLGSDGQIPAGYLAHATVGPANSSALGTVELPTSAGSPSTPVVPYRAASVQDQQITTTSQTTVLSYTPQAQGLFSVKIYARVVTAATNVTITITYTSPSGAQTNTVVNQSLGVGDWVFVPQTILATIGSAISVNVTAATANQVYVSAAIEGV